MPKRTNGRFANRQRMFNEAFEEALIKPDARAPELKLVIVGLVVGQDSVVNEAAIGDEFLVWSDPEKREATQTQPLRLFADEVIVVAAVSHSHGIQPSVHASAEF